MLTVLTVVWHGRTHVKIGSRCNLCLEFCLPVPALYNYITTNSQFISFWNSLQYLNWGKKTVTKDGIFYKDPWRSDPFSPIKNPLTNKRKNKGSNAILEAVKQFTDKVDTPAGQHRCGSWVKAEIKDLNYRTGPISWTMSGTEILAWG